MIARDFPLSSQTVNTLSSAIAAQILTIRRLVMNNFMIFNIILSLHLIKYILQGEFIKGLLIDMNIFVKK